MGWQGLSSRRRKFEGCLGILGMGKDTKGKLRERESEGDRGREKMQATAGLQIWC